jgi:hypothetical protein
MIAILACVVIGQGSPALSAEEIQRRLEAPIIYQTDPVRLPVALDAIGSMVGVRIRCEPELQPAVVVVAVRGKPAKEVIQHLMDGIGAAPMIQAGTYHVGLRLVTPEQSAKQRELEIKAISAALAAKMKSIKADEPMDPNLPNRIAQYAILALQSSPTEYRPPHSSLYSAQMQTPAVRATTAILNVVGAELLRNEGDRPKIVDMRSLDEGQASKVRAVLARYEQEQAMWSAPFEPVYKLLASSQYAPIGEELLERSLPLGKAKPDGFRIRVASTQWGRSAQIEILAGGVTVADIADWLPNQRIYTDPGGEYFGAAKANQITVPLGDKVKWMESARRPNKDGTAKAYDFNLFRLLSDPWRNEPISYTRAQCLPAVSEKLGLNLVTYLGDALVNQLLYDYYGQGGDTAKGDQVLNLTGYGAINGLRKKGDWLIGYCVNPEAYLSSQLDRNGLAKFLMLANKPGALTFEQFLKARKELGASQLQVARQFARLIRPGFDSLNPVSIEVLDLLAKLTPGQLNMAKRSGLPVASLDSDLERQFRRYVGYQRRRNQYNIPDDSIDAPPTLDDFRRARIILTQESIQGLIFLDGSNTLRVSFTPYAYYSFQSFDQFRGMDAASAISVGTRSRLCWPARMETIRIHIEIPRKRSQVISTTQFLTDVSVNPLAKNQIIQVIDRYFNGN